MLINQCKVFASDCAGVLTESLELTRNNDAISSHVERNLEQIKLIISELNDTNMDSVFTDVYAHLFSSLTVLVPYGMCIVLDERLQNFMSLCFKGIYVGGSIFNDAIKNPVLEQLRSGYIVSGSDEYNISFIIEAALVYLGLTDVANSGRDVAEAIEEATDQISDQINKVNEQLQNINTTLNNIASSLDSIDNNISLIVEFISKLVRLIEEAINKEFFKRDVIDLNGAISDALDEVVVINDGDKYSISIRNFEDAKEALKVMRGAIRQIIKSSDTVAAKLHAFYGGLAWVALYSIINAGSYLDDLRNGKINKPLHYRDTAFFKQIQSNTKTIFDFIKDPNIDNLLLKKKRLFFCAQLTKKDDGQYFFRQKHPSRPRPCTPGLYMKVKERVGNSLGMIETIVETGNIVKVDRPFDPYCEWKPDFTPIVDPVIGSYEYKVLALYNAEHRADYEAYANYSLLRKDFFEQIPLLEKIFEL